MTAIMLGGILYNVKHLVTFERAREQYNPSGQRVWAFITTSRNDVGIGILDESEAERVEAIFNGGWRQPTFPNVLSAVEPAETLLHQRASALAKLLPVGTTWTFSHSNRQSTHSPIVLRSGGEAYEAYGSIDAAIEHLLFVELKSRYGQTELLKSLRKLIGDAKISILGDTLDDCRFRITGLAEMPRQMPPGEMKFGPDSKPCFTADSLLDAVGFFQREEKIKADADHVATPGEEGGTT